METSVSVKRAKKNEYPHVVVTPEVHAKLRSLASPDRPMQAIASMILEDGLSKLERAESRNRPLSA